MKCGATRLAIFKTLLTRGRISASPASTLDRAMHEHFGLYALLPIYFVGEFGAEQRGADLRTNLIQLGGTLH
jgi:hypothetical protein